MARTKNRQKRRRPDNTPKGKRFFGYIRISDITGREDTLVSDDLQERAITQWARMNEATIVEWVRDLGFSGTSSDKRQIRETIDRVADGQADGIVVYKIDRWGRDLLDSSRNILDLQNAGGIIASATEALDNIDSAGGNFQLTQLLAMAEYQARQIGGRWSDLHAYRLSEGVPMAGGKRFGYVYNPSQGKKGLGSYVLDEDGVNEDGTEHRGTAPALREMYHRYIRGESLTVIVDWLRERGFTTTGGGQFSKSSIYTTLDSGFAAGYLVQNDTEKEWGVDRRYETGGQPKAIDEATWQLYCDRRRRKVAPRTKSAPYRLAGLVWCAGCQKRTYKNSVRQYRVSGNYDMAFLRCHLPAKQRAYMTCPNPARMAMHLVEAAVYSWLDERSDATNLAQIEINKRLRVDVIQQDKGKVERDLQKAKTRLLTATKRSLLDDSDPKFLAPQTFQLLQADTNEEIKRLTEQLDKLGIEERVNTVSLPDTFAALKAGWDVVDATILNEALQREIQAIYIHPVGHEPRVQIIPRWEEDPFHREDGRKTWGRYRRQAAAEAGSE